MGRLKILIEKNRCEKIARHKRRKKLKPRKRPTSIPSVEMTNSQKVFKRDSFYQKPSICNRDNSIIKFPKSFNLIDNPDESLSVLKQINYSFEKSNSKTIKFDYSECSNYGLDASVICDLLVDNGKKYRNNNKKKVKLSGNMPVGYSAGELFCNSGLLRHLNLFNAEDKRVERLEPFINEKNVNVLTNKTIVYYNNCLKRYGMELNAKGIDLLNHLVGEIIGNAAEHSGDNGDWYVSGHFTQATNHEYGKGSLVFISIGNTIYENLKYNTKSPEILEKLDNHLKCHKSLFDFNWNEESSLTVLGLQYKISSVTDFDHPDRGTGTIEFIKSFSELGKKIDGDIPKMSILSGNTHILFDGTYNLEEKNINGTKVKTIAFNKDNNIKKKPDQKYVKILKNRFPGVIISADFYVDNRYVRKMEGKNE